MKVSWLMFLCLLLVPTLSWGNFWDEYLGIDRSEPVYSYNAWRDELRVGYERTDEFLEELKPLIQGSEGAIDVDVPLLVQRFTMTEYLTALDCAALRFLWLRSMLPSWIEDVETLAQLDIAYRAKKCMERNGGPWDQAKRRLSQLMIRWELYENVDAVSTERRPFVLEELLHRRNRPKPGILLANPLADRDLYEREMDLALAEVHLFHTHHPDDEVRARLSEDTKRKLAAVYQEMIADRPDSTMWSGALGNMNIQIDY